MGCDFYSQLYYLFMYRTPEGKEEHYEEPVGQRESWYIGYYDPDIETREDAMNRAIENFGLNETKTLYENDKWFCIEACKENMESIMASHHDKPVVKIIKYNFVWAR
jgi:hypothetical protein